MSVILGTGTKQSNYPSSNPAGMRDGWEPQYKKQQMDIYFTNDTTLSLPEPLMATDASGNKWKQSYVYGAGGERISMSYLPSADASTDWEPTSGASGAAGNTTPKTLYYMSDVRGSAIGLLGADGSVSARYNYDEFGVAKNPEKFDLNWAGPDNLFGYTGLGYDFNSGHSYARARYFDSEVGRFISEDTYEGELNNPQTLNLYTYVLNNPLRYTDLSGHMIVHGAGVGGTDSHYVDLSKLNQLELTSIMGNINNPSSTRQAAANEFVRRNFILVENGALKVASSVNSLVKNAKKALNVMKAEKVAKISQGVIKNFNMDYLMIEKARHVFSQDHITNGIMELGKNREEIMKSGFKIVEEINNKGLLKEGPTQIKTMINGFEAEVRIFVQNGKLISFDMFKGHSSRTMGKTITYP